MIGQVFETVWDAIESDPAEAAKLRTRSDLMSALTAHIKAQKWTQAKAAEYLGIAQPQVSDLMRGKLSRFSLDSLVMLVARAGLKLSVKVTKQAASKRAA
jgi:predicted XRE-type DNA-binding protein